MAARVVTMIFLPDALITGIFGMDVAGLPGLGIRARSGG